MIIGLRDTDITKTVTVSKTYEIASKKITFESGKIALLANGSVVIKDEDGNYLLTTVGIKEEAKEGTDFFPLTVEFQEKYYANGKMGGNKYSRREGKTSEAAILNSRIIDRPIRPMFPKGTINEAQIIATMLSSSGASDFGFYGVTGASLSLLLAGCVDFEGPVSGARVIVDQNGKMKFDPTFEELKTAQLDLTVAGSMDAITMVESQGQEVSSEIILKAFDFAFGIIKEIGKAQIDFVEEYKKHYALPSIKLTVKQPNEGIKDNVKKFVDQEKIEKLYRLGKVDFHHKLEELAEETKEYLSSSYGEEKMAEIGSEDIFDAVYGTVKKYMRSKVLSEKTRLDGRQLDEVRPIKTEIGILPRVHGSALFQRGLTQAVTIVTLGGPGDIQMVDDMFEPEAKKYIHHYNFPPFSVGEIKGLRGPSRRDVGHGRLAEKALEPVLPSMEEFPYAIRAVSETMTCNGSSSMASVCGSSLSLMDAGVPIKNVVSGVAIGMVYDDESGKYEILSDIQAQEDFLGDLDFKVAGTKKGITALQMDCKIKGLKLEVIENVFKRAEKALDQIRTDMTKELSAPRSEVSQYAPVILTTSVPMDKIREVIGKGGETIQKIVKDFEVDVDINNDNGQVSVTAKNREAGKAALEHIISLVKDLEVGDVLTGEAVKIIMGTGVIIDLGKGKSGMIHISKIAKQRVENIEEFVKVGDHVEVRVITVDRAANRIGLERIVKED
ncbi:MAG: polyribonucleotide nucleotidyltransferase [Candidatus Gracilibacteria bacterium]|nr:polyribonucleotide nucleotidyltransferase [Candidatus Gracilibacteria bacterium]